MLTRLDLSEKNVPMVIAACCILHNICEAKGGKLPLGWSYCLMNLISRTSGLLQRAQCGAVCLRVALKVYSQSATIVLSLEIVSVFSFLNYVCFGFCLLESILLCLLQIINTAEPGALPAAMNCMVLAAHL